MKRIWKCDARKAAIGAYLLPHLMANYGYNQINTLSADSILKLEKPKFDKSFERENQIVYPKDSQLLTVNTQNDKIIGTYQNTKDWPDISIDKKDNYYIFKWGILNGKICKTSEDKYSSNLGVLIRDFEIRNKLCSSHKCNKLII